jgi:hypothetical protein
MSTHCDIFSYLSLSQVLKVVSLLRLELPAWEINKKYQRKEDSKILLTQYINLSTVISVPPTYFPTKPRFSAYQRHTDDLMALMLGFAKPSAWGIGRRVIVK